MKTILAIVAVLAVLLSSTLAAQPLLPYDNTDKAPHFTAFKMQLESAVAERDAAFFRSRYQGSDSGAIALASLEEKYHLSDPNDPFWTTMDRMLKLGGRWQADSEMVVYPYVYADFPKNVDPFNHDVVVDENVTLLNGADPSSFSVGKVSQEIVWVLEREEQWSRVRAISGLTGWIENRYLYSPVDFRMGVGLVDGRWAILFLQAGR